MNPTAADWADWEAGGRQGAPPGTFYWHHEKLRAAVREFWQGLLAAFARAIGR